MKPVVKKRVLLTLMMILFSLFLFGVTYSWFVNSTSISNPVIGKTRSAYFAAGDGTENDPFIIRNANHFFNLSYLQNFGLFDDQMYYFEVSGPNGESITIDFCAPDVLEAYRTIQPIGTGAFPFKGYFDGNASVLKCYNVDGTNQQDIGTFGFIDNGSTVKNLYMDQPVIMSNPEPDQVFEAPHGHNDGEVNVATGYIVGHVAEFAVLENVFVISPTISSLGNQFFNRSQYGLIGYSETDGGNIAGGPRESSYDFVIDAPQAFTQLDSARTLWGNWYVNGSATVTLADVLVQPSGVIDMRFGIENSWPKYSLSTLRISQTPNDSDPEYLYDKMVEENLEIKGRANETEPFSFYSRENIDMVGFMEFRKSNLQVRRPATPYTIPQIGTTFEPTTYNRSILLYVRPTEDLTNLGNIRATFDLAGDMAYASGFSTNGTYQAGAQRRLIPFGGNDVNANMSSLDALTAVRIDENTGDLIVVDSDVTTPDYYVFAIISNTNGAKEIIQINFKYVPAALNADSLTSIANVDFINDVADVNIADIENYDFSFVNFGYSLNEFQALEITTNRLADQSYEMILDYAILDDSIFFVDIINIYRYAIVVRYDGNIIYSGSHQIIELRMTQTGIIVSSRDV